METRHAEEKCWLVLKCDFFVFLATIDMRLWVTYIMKFADFYEILEIGWQDKVNAGYIR